ncbi:MAG: hypothetical protein GC205_05845 [Bacteroidetes bacterium]|nr:hypothetical protein [Bacteroidota bacterium]
MRRWIWVFLSGLCIERLKNMRLLNNYRRFCAVWAVLMMLFGMMATGCTYTLKLTDASFPPELKSVSIENFDNTSSFAVPGLSQRFTEALRDKFTRETNLFVSDEPGGEWTFSGAITRYAITPIAPTGDELTALNRLTITVAVDFENTLQEESGWSSSFSRFADYESSSQLGDVQDGLIDDINLQLVQDVFNKVASNW